MGIHHDGKHIANLMGIKIFQKLGVRFEPLDNFSLHVFSQGVELNIKLVKSFIPISKRSCFNFQATIKLITIANVVAKKKGSYGNKRRIHHLTWTLAFMFYKSVSHPLTAFHFQNSNCFLLSLIPQ
jgi:hypothetical protein